MEYSEKNARTLISNLSQVINERKARMQEMQQQLSIVEEFQAKLGTMIARTKKSLSDYQEDTKTMGNICQEMQKISKSKHYSLAVEETQLCIAQGESFVTSETDPNIPDQLLKSTHELFDLIERAHTEVLSKRKDGPKKVPRAPSPKANARLLPADMREQPQSEVVNNIRPLVPTVPNPRVQHNPAVGPHPSPPVGPIKSLRPNANPGPNPNTTLVRQRFLILHSHRLGK
jgi:hypothetical protein